MRSWGPITVGVGRAQEPHSGLPSPGLREQTLQSPAVPYRPLWSPGLLKPSVGDPADSKEGCCSTPFFLGRKNIPLALVLLGIDLFQVPGTHLHGDCVFSRS